MKKGALIGRGMTAKVYEWGPCKVLKLYSERYDERWAEHEAKIGKAVYQAGAPSPRVFETVNLDGRSGVVFEKISGRMLIEQMLMEPCMIYHYMRKVARLHFVIHSCTSKKLPAQTERFKLTLGLSSKLLGDRYDRILDYMKRLPDGNQICHGDMHIGNVMVSDGELIPIDWSAAYIGCPLGDVARTCLIITSPAAPPFIPDIITKLSGCFKNTFHQTYLDEYMRLSKASIDDIDEWILPAAAAKLKDNVPGERKWLMNMIDERLERYEKTKLHEVKQNGS